jgi:hypothetical protein
VARRQCGVEEGGRDEYSTEAIETLCSWIADGAALLSLSLVDVALCGLARDGNGSYQSRGIAVLNETLSSGRAAQKHISLKSLNISGCKIREDDAHHLGKGLSRNRTLEKLVLDKTPLMVQQLLRGERLSLHSVDFSEVDATLMAQLLQQDLALTCIDLGGAKPLPKEIKVLSDAFARLHGRASVRELSVSGRCLGLEGSASLLDALKDCPLEVLDFAPGVVSAAVRALGAIEITTRDRRSDNGNLVMDARFGIIAEPVTLGRALSLTPGIVEHGIFPGSMVERIVVAGAAGVHELVNDRR